MHAARLRCLRALRPAVTRRSNVATGGARYGGLGVRAAVRGVVEVLGPAVIGQDATEQGTIDEMLRRADSTPTLAKLGSNAVLAVSVATVLAAAAAAGQPLFEYLAATSGSTPLLPMPMVNILSGGAHAGGLLDVQDFLVVPIGARDFTEAIEMAAAVRRATAVSAERLGHSSALGADEGGLGLALDSNRAAMDLLVSGIEGAGLVAVADAAIAIDVAANQLAAPDGYRLAAENRTLSADQWQAELREWVNAYPIVSLEDVLAEDAWQDWADVTRSLEARVQLIGDDLFATDTARLARGIEAGVANSILVKPNQVGTISDAADVIRAAVQAGYTTVASARSGDTEDNWLADLAVGWAAGQIKVGSTTRSERTAKWNRLLRIEHALGSQARFAGGQVLARSRTGVRAPVQEHNR